MRELQRREAAGGGGGDAAALGPVPGKQTRVGGDAEAGVHAAAQRGTSTPSSRLPHADSIQRAFGRHDISGIQAHTGGEAAASAREMGAQAYATGDHVVMGSGTDLFTAAHEAAHVVQQRAGVHLKGGVGAANDAHEQHADDVASLVVQGKSAESLLDTYAGGGGGGGAGAVQRKMEFTGNTGYLDPDGAGRGIDLAGYRATIAEAKAMGPRVTVREGIPRVGAAVYQYDTQSPDREGAITVRPLAAQDLAQQTDEYHDRLISTAHETRHAIDDLNRDVRDFRTNNEARIRTEWRAFATQSAVAMQLNGRGAPFPARYLRDLASYASVAAFQHTGSAMFATTGSYMRLYGLTPDQPSDAEVSKFMRDHLVWIQEAIALFNSLIPAHVPVQQAPLLQPEGVQLSGLTVVGGIILISAILLGLAHHYGLI